MRERNKMVQQTFTDMDYRIVKNSCQISHKETNAQEVAAMES